MGKFQIYSKDILIGETDLEKGDPPMGVAFGLFAPHRNYVNFRKLCQNSLGEQSVLELKVKIGNLKVECAGVGIDDYVGSEEDEITIHVLGISKPSYEELFLGRKAKYERSAVSPFNCKVLT